MSLIINYLINNKFLKNYVKCDLANSSQINKSSYFNS